MLCKIPVCHRQVVDPTTVFKPSLRDNPSASIFAPMRTRPFPAPHWTNEGFVVLTRANAQHAIQPFLLGMTKGFGQVPIRNVNERGGCSKCAVPTLPLPNVNQAIHYILHLVLPIRKYEDVICKTQIQQTTHTVSKTYPTLWVCKSPLGHCQPKRAPLSHTSRHVKRSAIYLFECATGIATCKSIGLKYFVHANLFTMFPDLVYPRCSINRSWWSTRQRRCFAFV